MAILGRSARLASADVVPVDDYNPLVAWGAILRQDDAELESVGLRVGWG